MKLGVSRKGIDRIKAEVAVLPFFQDERPLKGGAGQIDWRMNGAISELILKKVMIGELGESVLIVPNRRVDCEKILMVGLGISSACTEETLQSTARQIVEQMARINVSDFSLYVPQDRGTSLGADQAAAAMMQGLAYERERDINITFVTDKDGLEGVREKIQKAGRETKINVAQA